MSESVITTEVGWANMTIEEGGDPKQKLMVSLIVRDCPLDYDVKKELTEMGHKKPVHYHGVITYEERNARGGTGTADNPNQIDQFVTLLGTYEILNGIQFHYLPYVTHIAVHEMEIFPHPDDIKQNIQKCVQMLTTVEYFTGFQSVHDLRRENIRYIKPIRAAATRTMNRTITRMDKMGIKNYRNSNREYNQANDIAKSVNRQIDAIANLK